MAGTTTTTTASSSPLSLWSRKRDLTYFIFFATHIPIIFLVDTVPLLPSLFQTDLAHQIREFYITTFHDKFFEEPPQVWFQAFLWMELLYHVPLSIYALVALPRNDHMLPVHLLVFGVQAFVTSLTCLANVWSWTDRSETQKLNITFLYAPYVLLGAFIAFDMISRLRGKLNQKTKRE